MKVRIELWPLLELLCRLYQLHVRPINGVRVEQDIGNAIYFLQAQIDQALFGRVTSHYQSVEALPAEQLNMLPQLPDSQMTLRPSRRLQQKSTTNPVLIVSLALGPDFSFGCPKRWSAPANTATAMHRIFLVGGRPQNYYQVMGRPSIPPMHYNFTFCHHRF